MPEDSRDLGRFFIVGAARSGTTLLQAMLANHPGVFSFPESHFFCHAAPRGRRRRLGLVRKDLARDALQKSAGLLRLSGEIAPSPAWSPFFRSYCAAFVRAVDAAAASAGKRAWVEKTPHHIDFIPTIMRRVPRSRFIHILRDGRDVVASQFYAQQQDPGYWSGWSLAQMARQWNTDLATSLAYMRDGRHLLVSYEDLLTDTQGALRRLTAFMGIEFHPAMLRHWEATDRILGDRKNEPWMQTAFEPLQDRRGKKFRTVLDPGQRRMVETELRFRGDLGPLFAGIAGSAIGPVSDQSLSRA